MFCHCTNFVHFSMKFSEMLIKFPLAEDVHHTHAYLNKAPTFSETFIAYMHTFQRSLGLFRDVHCTHAPQFGRCSSHINFNKVSTSSMLFTRCTHTHFNEVSSASEISIFRTSQRSMDLFGDVHHTHAHTHITTKYQSLWRCSYISTKNRPLQRGS